MGTVKGGESGRLRVKGGNGRVKVKGEESERETVKGRSGREMVEKGNGNG